MEKVALIERGIHPASVLAFPRVSERFEWLRYYQVEVISVRQY